MNSKLEVFKSNINGKKIAVLGLGISNIPAIEYLHRLGAIIYAHDIKEEINQKLKNMEHIIFMLGKDNLKNLNEMDYILRSPGIKPFTKEIERAQENGVILTSEIELLIQLCPCKVIGITGSDGKTTTTTIVSKMLEAAGHKVWLGGNIGLPIFSYIDDIKEEDIVVLELSSFQLMTMKKSPNIAAITNISENHLDYHRSYQEYIAAKSKIFLFQKESDILVLNQENKYSKAYELLAKSINPNGTIKKFSIKQEVENGAFYQDGNFCYSNHGRKEQICPVSYMKLVGMHNVDDICTAITIVWELVKKEDIIKVIQSFGGVEHRMEFFHEENGVKWYNDSIASTPTRTIAGLKAFDQKVILVAGGYDKHIDYDIMGSCLLDKVKTLLLVGDTSTKIENAVSKELAKENRNTNIEIKKFDDLKSCVDYAKSIAKEGDIVALSPASASFDLYKNFEERGRLFKKLVSNK
ncbi:MAG: UDP-N-acetylmuramoyl-L-alanine--D-glutamate ligase [Clostridia bacterium]|nr:UDP-N-acetylmuramoyl-L-alanine--D-glutamate ligase [Clostridia bacterium]